MRPVDLHPFEIIDSPTCRPTVISAKDAVQPSFKMYDAIPSPEKLRPSVDSEIEKFLPLLNDYLSRMSCDQYSQPLSVLKDLRVNDISLSPPDQPKKEQDTVTPSEGASKTPKVTGDDYVWDIFYRRPAKAGEWAGKDNIATLYVSMLLL